MFTRIRPGLLVALALMAGCDGAMISEVAPGAPSDVDPRTGEPLPAFDPGPAPLRQITPVQFLSSANALLKMSLPSTVLDPLPPGGTFDGYTGQAEGQANDRVLVEGYSLAAEAVAKLWFQGTDAQRYAIIACNPPTPTDAACLKQVSESLAERAFRRAVEPGELDTLVAAAAAAQLRENRFSSGVRVVIEGLLQAPSFLYRVEEGAPGTTHPQFRQLDSWAVASRLSFSLTDSIPDDELAAAARANALQTRDQVMAQARRLIETPAAQETLTRYFDEWALVTELPNEKRDAAAHPGFTPQIAQDMQRELELNFAALAFSDRSMKELLTLDRTFVSPGLAQFYGLTLPAGSSTGFVSASLDDHRRGLWSLGGMLSAGQRLVDTAPVHRGRTVRERFFCEPVPPPPAGVSDQVPPSSAVAVTTRQRMEQHMASPSCAGCHRYLDGMGFGLEKFDATGRWREQEKGVDIDDRGALVTADGTKDFRGAVELSRLLGEDPQVMECMVRQLFVRTVGRAYVDTDLRTVRLLSGNWAKGGYRFKELAVAMLADDALRFAQ